MKLTCDKKMIEVFKTYFVCRNSCTFMPFSEDYESVVNPFYIYYRDVEIAYYSLTKEEREIVRNEYLTPASASWWRSKYDFKQFEIIKEQVCGRFLTKFNEIHN